jgi:hypothetical protein
VNDHQPMPRIRGRLARSSPAVVAAALLAGALGLGGAAALAAVGYSYLLGYGTPDCPTRSTCADPGPRVRQTPAKYGIDFSGDAVNGFIGVWGNSAGPGTQVQLRADREPPTKAGRGTPTPPAGTSLTPIADYLDYEVLTGNQTGPKVRSYRLRDPVPLRITPLTPQADSIPGVQDGVTPNEIVVYLRENDGWRELPRVADVWADGVVESFDITQDTRGNLPGVRRVVHIHTDSPAATVGVFRRVALPPPPPPPPPVAAPAPAPKPAVLAFRGRKLQGALRLSRQGTFRAPCALTGAAFAQCTFTATAPVRSGRLVRNGSRRGVKQVTVAKGSASFAGKPVDAVVRLTPTGRRLMRRYRRLPVLLRQQLSAPGAVAASRDVKISLLPARKAKKKAR